MQLRYSEEISQELEAEFDNPEIYYRACLSARNNHPKGVHAAINEMTDDDRARFMNILLLARDLSKSQAGNEGK